MTTSSAEVTRLDAYEPSLAPVHEGLTLIAARLEAAAGQFFAGAGPYASGSAEAVGTPVREVLDQSDYLAAWVTTVAAAFRSAGGDPDGDGALTAPEAALDRLVLSPVLAEERAAVAAELATLAERARAGDLVLTPAQLAAVVDRARRLVDGSPDPAAEAARLLEHMGSGDVDVAVTLLERDARRAAGPDDPSVGALLDLGHVVSLGLESQPDRAALWADDLVDRRATVLDLVPGAAVEGLSVMGAGNAPGAAAFGVALYGQLAGRSGRTPAGGLVDRLYGATEPGAASLVTAGRRDEAGRRDQAALAHGIVDELSAGDGRRLYEVMGPAAPAEIAGIHRDVVLASVDPGLPDDARVRLAHRLAALYLEQPGPLGSGRLPPYPPEVTTAFAAATQPLMESSMGGDATTVDLDPAGSASMAPVAVVWDAVAEYGVTPGGPAGLRHALDGVTANVLGDALASGAGPGADSAGSTYPLDPNRLKDLGNVYEGVAARVANERFASVVSSLEDGSGFAPGVGMSVVSGIVGEFPGGSTAVGFVDAAIALDAERHVTGGANPLVGAEVNLIRELVAVDIVARPDIVTPGLRARLMEVAASEGSLGVYEFVRDVGGAYPPTDGNGGIALTRLRELVLAQAGEVDLGSAITIAQATDLGEGG
jgi:hypothetical protein